MPDLRPPRGAVSRPPAPVTGEQAPRRRRAAAARCWPTCGSRSRSSWPCSTRRACSAPRTCSPRRRCPASTTRRWTATRSGPPTPPARPSRTRWCCRWSATSRPGRGAPRAVTRGLCLRIMTGAPVPSGRGLDRAGGVDRRRGRPGPRSTARPSRAAYVRRTGEDIRTGELAVRSGTPIGPAQVGLLAAVGRERVLVRPRPRVVVLSTGSELVDVGRRPGTGRDPRLQQLRAGRGRPGRRCRGLPGRHRAGRPRPAARACWRASCCGRT